MYAFRYLILLSFFIFPLTGSCQNNYASNVDIFGDLPIFDPERNSVLEKGESGEERIQRFIKVNGILNKTRCYVGEPVRLHFEILSALKNKSFVTQVPSFDGFMIIGINPDNSIALYKNIGGVEYRSSKLKEFQLLPSRAGIMEIDPIVVNNVVTTNNKKMTPYSGIVKSPAVKLTVVPLPEKGKPASFTGAVGNFTFRAWLEKDSLAAGESNTIKIEIGGSGNFHSVSVPAVKWPEGFQHFEPGQVSKVNEQEFPAKGKLLIDIPFTTDKKGEYIIPAIEFTYFDPGKISYISKTDTAMALHVAAAKAVINTPVAVKEKKTTGNTWLFIIAGILAAIALLMFRKRASVQAQSQAKPEADIREMQLRDDLAALEKNELNDNFIMQLKPLLIHYLQYKLQTPNAWTADMIRDVKALDQRTGQRIEELLAECDMLLYGHIIPDKSHRQKMIESLKVVISDISTIV